MNDVLLVHVAQVSLGGGPRCRADLGVGLTSFLGKAQMARTMHTSKSGSGKRKYANSSSDEKETSSKKPKKPKVTQPIPPLPIPICPSTEMVARLAAILPSDAFPTGVLQIVSGYLTPFLAVKPQAYGVTIHDAFSDETLAAVDCNPDLLWRTCQISICPVDSGRVVVLLTDDEHQCAFRMLNLYTLSWEMSTPPNQDPEYCERVGAYQAILHPMKRALMCANSWIYRINCHDFKWVNECKRLATICDSGVVILIDMMSATSYPLMLPAPVESVLAFQVVKGSIILEARRTIYVLSASFPHVPLGMMSKLVPNALTRRPAIPPTMPLSFFCTFGSTLALLNPTRSELVVWDPCAKLMRMVVFNFPSFLNETPLSSWLIVHLRSTPGRTDPCVLMFNPHGHRVYWMTLNSERRCRIEKVSVPSCLLAQTWLNVFSPPSDNLNWFGLQTAQKWWSLQLVQAFNMALVPPTICLSLNVLGVSPLAHKGSQFVLLP